jgi:hypothetical protein
METLGGPLQSLPAGTEVPIVLGTSKPTVNSSQASSPAPKISPAFAGDLLGYLYLCCKAAKDQAEARAFGSMTNPYAGLPRALKELDSHTFKNTDTMQGEFLAKLLKVANIPADSWNAVVRQVSSSKRGREILNQATTKGEALALGLPEDASKQLREAERKLQRDEFNTFEMARLAQLTSDSDSTVGKKKDGTKILLYSIKTSPKYAIPSDGFANFSSPVLWCAGSALIKLKGFIAGLLVGREMADMDPVVQSAKSRTWFKPEGLSVKSPTIQALVKRMASQHVETEIDPIHDKKGYLLEFRFYIKPGHLQALADRLRRQG